MNSNPDTAVPATPEAQDVLKILQDVAQVYELIEGVRRELARLSIATGATYQQSGDALGRDRSTAHTLINGRAA